MNNNPSYINAIRELTIFLSECYSFRDKMVKEYFQSFSSFVYIIKNIFRFKLYFLNWKKRINKKLTKYVPYSRYIAHFNHPKYIDIKLPGVNSDLINYYYSKFEAHINALQDIIWNLKDEEIQQRNSDTSILTLNLNKATLQYKNKKPISISLNTQPMKLLKLLLDNYDNIVEYKNIAKHLKLNAYYEGINNNEIAREVNYIRKSLVKELSRAGMSSNDVGKYIVTIKGIGYKATLTT